MTSPSDASPYRWHHELKQLFVLALDRYRTGERDPRRFFSVDQTNYLASIGQTPQELFDFAEDHEKSHEPDWETVLLISSARRDYFLTVQHGVHSKRVTLMDELPAKEAELGGIKWLPRAIAKAESKLRGEMPPELMFDCGGDRNFFREHGLAPGDFLRNVWSAHGDADKMLKYVRGEAG